MPRPSSTLSYLMVLSGRVENDERPASAIRERGVQTFGSLETTQQERIRRKLLSFPIRELVRSPFSA